VFAVATMSLVGCRQDMHDAPRYDPLEASELFHNGASGQPLVAGTVARGQLNDDELLTTGKVNGQVVDQFPFAISHADIDRGEERFNIFCSPCHGRTGRGNGMVVQRGFRQPPSYHIDRLRQAPAGYFFDAMTNGFGVMPDYRAQVTVADRWRIVAYIRALQASYHATVADLPADLQSDTAKLDAPPPAAASAHGAAGPVEGAAHTTGGEK
jgi:mono/diheme cytochrome c family protein